MKRIALVVAVGLGVGLGLADGADLGRYSSRAALLGQRTEADAPLRLVAVVEKLSTRSALLAHRKGAPSEAQPAVAAAYDTKAAVRGERAVEFELAPLK